jgi:hypothetical protein
MVTKLGVFEVSVSSKLFPVPFSDIFQHTRKENCYARVVGSDVEIYSYNWSNYFSDSSTVISRFDAVVRAVRGTCHHFKVFNLHFSSVSFLVKWVHKLDTELSAWSTSPLDKSFSPSNYLFNIIKREV